MSHSGTIGAARALLVACAFALLIMASTVVVTASGSLTSEERMRICGSDSDCVRVFASSQAQMVVDGLDLSTDTPADVLRRVPSWFGPAERPLLLGRTRFQVLDTDVPLRTQNVAVGEVLQLLLPTEKDGADL